MTFSGYTDDGPNNPYPHLISAMGTLQLDLGSVFFS